MNTKLTVNEIIASDMAIAEILNDKIPATLAFRLSLIKKALAPTMDSFNTRRTALVESLGTPVEGQPGNYQIKEIDAIKKFNDTMTELGKEVIDVTVNAASIPLSLLESAGTVKGSAINALMWIIDAPANDAA